jgi:translocation and assembly module TamA
LIALTLAVAVGVGSVSPSFGIWPFTRRDRDLEAIPDPTPYTIEINVIGGNRRLDRTLRNSSNLYVLRRTPPSGLVGLLARARNDVARLTAALYREALYAGQISVTIDGRPLESVNPFDAIGLRPVPVVVDIIPREPFHFGAVNASPLPPGVSLKDIGLVPGKLADSDTIVAAEDAITLGWERRGHPLAEVAERDIIANHQTRILSVSLAVHPGPAADFGRVEVVGADKVNPNLVLRRAGIDPGSLYSSDVTKRAEKRLRDLGVFDSVRVVTADSLDPNGTIPITIEVSERKPRVIGVGGYYSNTEGAGAQVYWMHRNLFGGAEQLRLSAEVSRLFEGAWDEPDYRVAANFVKPAIIGPMTDFTLRAETYRETTDAYRVTANEFETGLVQVFSDSLTGGLDVEIEQSHFEDAVQRRDDYLLATLTASLDWDRRDDRFDPTKGFRVYIEAAPAYDFLHDTPLATFKNDVSIYRAVDGEKRFVLAGRVQGGLLTAEDIREVPPNRRLFAGGPGTVRGYAYQSLAPKNCKGELLGGRSMFAASAELRYRATPSLGVVAFVDAGNAYASLWPELDDLKVGVGAGVRYLTPVGPLRVDLAFPLEPDRDDPWVALYVGLGQAF